MPTPRPSTWDDLQLLGSSRLGTISGAGLKVSTLIRYRFFRLGGDPADTFPATIFPSSVSIHFQSDSDGSTAQNAKY